MECSCFRCCMMLPLTFLFCWLIFSYLPLLVCLTYSFSFVLIFPCFCYKQFLNILNAENGYHRLVHGFTFPFLLLQKEYRQKLQDEQTLDLGIWFGMLVSRGRVEDQIKSFTYVDEMCRSAEFDKNIKHNQLQSLPN